MLPSWQFCHCCEKCCVDKRFGMLGMEAFNSSHFALTKTLPTFIKFESQNEACFVKVLDATLYKLGGEISL